MFKDIALSFFVFFATTFISTYILTFFIRNDWRIQRPLRSSVVFALLVSFIGLNINITPVIARWIDTKVFQPKPANLSNEDMLKMKNDFLTALEQFVAQPEKVTPEVRNAAFNKFAPLFPNPQQDLTNYFNSISGFYDCQQAFYEDALQAMKTKKTVKSAKRKACHEADGSFFNRAHLIPDQQAKADDEVIELLAKGKKIVKDGKEVKVTEDLLKQSIMAQQKNKEILRMIFTNGQP